MLLHMVKLWVELATHFTQTQLLREDVLLLAPIVQWPACLLEGGYPNVSAKVIVKVLQSSAVQKIYNESHICN